MLFGPKNIAFGLDIGSKSVKLAECKLIKNIRGHRFLTLVALNEIPLPEDIIIGGEIKNPPVVVQAIKKCVKTAKGNFLSTRTVIASLPESRCYFKIIQAPKNSINNNDFACKLASKYFPIDADGVYCDWQLIGKTRAAIGAASKNIVDSYTDIIEQAGLIPLAVEIESTATARALAEKSKIGAARPKIIMDLGASSSTIIAVSRNSPLLVLNIPLSGNVMTKQIAKAQKISFKEAEKLKLNCAFDITKCPPKLRKIIVSSIDSSAAQIKSGLQYTSRLLKYRPDKIYICGGVSLMPKLTNVLSEKLKIKVRHANPLANIRLSKKLKISNQELLKYVTAIGLAIKGTENNNHNSKP